LPDGNWKPSWADARTGKRPKTAIHRIIRHPVALLSAG
jgi:hypothetical protein